MKDRPILFSGPMVRALLDGRKTQTRRLVKAEAPPAAVDAGVFDAPTRTYDGEWLWLDSKDLMDASWVGQPFRCPYGQPGDLLWVREEFSGPHELSTIRPGLWFPVCVPPPPIWWWADGNPPDGDWTRPKPSIHMPRWTSRLTLEITDVRVERLQRISEADARAEGLIWRPAVEAWAAVDDPNWPTFENPIRSYAGLWNHINGRGAWDANPWVWAVSFEVHRQNIDAVKAAKEAA